jgi:NTE family protein
MSEPGTAVALVLAGGGARGAYEVGALSVLLPELERRGQRPRLILGTSVGALNAGFLAAHAHLPADEAMRAARSIWEEIQWEQVARGPLSRASLRRVWQALCQMLGLRGRRLESLLDPAPLHATVRGWVDFAQIQANVQAGNLDVAGVVATSVLTGHSVVFHHGGISPAADDRRAIDYVATPLREDHVLASSAIPVAFPAVHVAEPERARGWYCDGGTRLNTPIRPALAFGAQRVVVIALGSVATEDRRGAPATGSRPGTLAEEERPDALVGIDQVLSGMFDDQLVADLHTLATINEILDGDAGHAPSPGRTIHRRRVPYIVVGPRTRDAIAERALAVARTLGATTGRAIRNPDIAALVRVVDGDADVRHAELLSLLLFTPAFARSLIDLGMEDARRWLDDSHELEGLWQVGPLH